MKATRTAVVSTIIGLLALGAAAVIAYGKLALPGEASAALWIAPLFGAIGGVMYELIALQGNIEWPHTSLEEEVPLDGFPHARIGFLYDLGILSRALIGAAAALAVFWIIPVEAGIKAVAVPILAGVSGTAVLRSLQDRLIAQIQTAKVKGLQNALAAIETTIKGNPVQAGASSLDVARLHGQIDTLTKLAKS